MTTLASSHALETFLTSEQLVSANPWFLSTPTRPFITISREAGSGGAALARLLARRLNGETREGATWRVFEDNLIPYALVEMGLPRWMSRFLPEQKTPGIRAWVGEHVGLHPNVSELIQKIHDTMCTLASEGNVILVGRGANKATAGMAGGIHVRLVAPESHRAKYLAERYQISEADALANNRRCDAARRAYVRSHWGTDDSDPSAFDLLINTGKVSLETASQLVMAQVRQKRSKTAS